MAFSFPRSGGTIITKNSQPGPPGPFTEPPTRGAVFTGCSAHMRQAVTRPRPPWLLEAIVHFSFDLAEKLLANSHFRTAQVSSARLSDLLQQFRRAPRPSWAGAVALVRAASGATASAWFKRHPHPQVRVRPPRQRAHILPETSVSSQIHPFHPHPCACPAPRTSNLPWLRSECGSGLQIRRPPHRDPDLALTCTLTALPEGDVPQALGDCAVTQPPGHLHG